MHIIRVQWGLVPSSYPLWPKEDVFQAPSHPTTSSHSYISADDINLDDPVDWAPDAPPNPNVYPLKLTSNRTRTRHQSDSEDILATFESIGSQGSDLWTLDPTVDNRSARTTNPVPSPPDPDLRLPLPCAPLRLSFDRPQINDDDLSKKIELVHQRRGEWQGAQDGEYRQHAGKSPPVVESEKNLEVSEPAHESSLTEEKPEHPLTPISPYPSHLTLSRGMLACWHSHYELLRAIAEGEDPAVLVLEDDIDMEFHLPKILERVWDALPDDWDVVFLGTCDLAT